jgi:hypothetical protein
MSSDTELETSGDESGVLTRAYRSVSPRYESHGDAAMDSIGWAMFLGLLVLLVPLLPFLVIVWLLEKAVGAVARQRGSE